MSIEIPAERAVRHGGADFYTLAHRFAETLELWGGLTGDARVLDVGCGPGRMAIGIGERFGWTNDYLGLDVIETDIRVAREHITAVHAQARFEHLDVFNGLYNPGGRMQPADVAFPVEADSVDFAFAASLFTHMFDADVARYLAELARVLRPGGTLLTTWFVMDETVARKVETGNARFRFAHVNADGTRTDRPDRPEEVIAFVQDRVEELFRLSGLEVAAFHRGAWPKLPGFKQQARHSQDCYVCRKR